MSTELSVSARFQRTSNKKHCSQKYKRVSTPHISCRLFHIGFIQIDHFLLVDTHTFILTQHQPMQQKICSLPLVVLILVLITTVTARVSSAKDASYLKVLERIINSGHHKHMHNNLILRDILENPSCF